MVQGWGCRIGVSGWLWVEVPSVSGCKGASSGARGGGLGTVAAGCGDPGLGLGGAGGGGGECGLDHGCAGVRPRIHGFFPGVPSFCGCW